MNHRNATDEHMNTKDFLRLGVPLGEATRRATDFVAKFILGGGDKLRLHAEVAAIVANPSAFLADDLRKDFAQAVLNAPPPPRAEPVDMAYKNIRDVMAAQRDLVTVLGEFMPKLVKMAPAGERPED